MNKDYKLGKIAIMSKDLSHNVSPRGGFFANKMDYETAIRLIGEMQDVWLWRLPTIEGIDSKRLFNVMIKQGVFL